MTASNLYLRMQDGTIFTPAWGNGAMRICTDAANIRQSLLSLFIAAARFSDTSYDPATNLTYGRRNQRLRSRGC